MKGFRYKPGTQFKIYIPENLSEWISEGGESDARLRARAKTISYAHFKNVTKNLLFFSVKTAIHQELENLLNHIVSFHLLNMKSEIERLAKNGAHIDMQKLKTKMLPSEKLIGENIFDSTSIENWRIKNSNEYSKLFNLISKHGMKSRHISRSEFRKSVKFSAYQGCDQVKKLFEIRYDKKSQAIEAYWSHIRDNILSDPQLSYFLRTSKKINLDYKEFEDSKKRFMNKYLKEKATV